MSIAPAIPATKKNADPARASGGVRRFVPAIVLVGLTVCAAWLRFHQLGGHGLWLDEACSVLYAHLPAGKFWRLMWKQEGNMVLYYVLLRGWVHVGDTEFLLRLPSAMFAVASIPLLYRLGRDLFSRTTGLIAAALLTVHWFHIFFSQDARSYALLIFLLLLSSWLFWQLAESPERKVYRVSYALVSALAMYAHMFAILIVAAQWLSLGPVRVCRIGWRRSFITLALFFLLALPMEAFALLRNRGQLIWVPRLTLRSFVDGMSAVAGFDNGQFLLLGLVLGVAVLAVVAAHRSASEQARFAVRLAGLWMIVPIAAIVAYSLHRPLFYSRFLIICVPGMLLLIAEGVAVMKRSASRLRWLWVPVLAVMLGMSLRATWQYYRAPMWPDWNSATHLIVANQQAGDGICFAGNGVEPFLYYLQRQTNTPWQSLPEVKRHAGFKCLSNTSEKQFDEQNGYRRVWLITTDPSPQEKVWIKENLVPRYGEAVPRGTFRGLIHIDLLARAGSKVQMIDGE